MKFATGVGIILSVTEHRLTAFVYHLDNDRDLVRVLCGRLELDGVLPLTPEEVDFEVLSAESDEEAEQFPAGKDPFRAVIQKADVVLFCLSDWFQDVADLEGAEWRQMLSATLEKKQGDLFVIPVCLEPCEVPRPLRRWGAVELHRARGYEDLMLSLQVRAERLGLTLKPRTDWRENPFMVEPEAEGEIEEVAPAANPAPRGSCAVGGILILVGLFIVVALFQFVTQLNTSRTANAAQTALVVNALAETATQNVIARGTARASTVTADAVEVRATFIQTEVFITGIAQTKTLAALPTLPDTPTFTPIAISLPTRIVDERNALMALVPGGDFTLGWDGDASVSPAHPLDLPAYYIDLYEVNNRAYQECVAAGACLPPASNASQTRLAYYTAVEFQDHPVLHVDWSMAQAYCAWREARLPTEAEWEKAARGSEAALHPWGDEAGCIFANHDACVGDTTAVDKYMLGVSEYGIFNLAGNAAEWTSSLWIPYPYSADDGREDPASFAPRVLRGGSWASPPADIFTYRRFSLDPATTSHEVGFRCARDVTP